MPSTIRGSDNFDSANNGVTSIATGNGLQGGPVTTTGTLSVACPTWGSVGSYAFVYAPAGTNIVAGSNYSGLYACSFFYNQCSAKMDIGGGNAVSGTWKWMGGSINGQILETAIACRVA